MRIVVRAGDAKNNGRWEIWTAMFPLLDTRGEERVSELRKWRLCTCGKSVWIKKVETVYVDRKVELLCF